MQIVAYNPSNHLKRELLAMIGKDDVHRNVIIIKIHTAAKVTSPTRNKNDKNRVKAGIVRGSSLNGESCSVMSVD
jgi:hypothetical protein